MKPAFAFIMVLFALNGMAQKTNEAPISPFGFRFDAGTTYSIPYHQVVEIWPDVEGHPITNYGSAWGFFVECLSTYRFGNRFGLSSGLEWGFNKMSVEQHVGAFFYDGTRTTSYLTMPLLANYRFTNHSPFTLMAGPYVGFLLSAKEKGTQYFDESQLPLLEDDPVEINPQQPYNDNLDDHYTNAEFGLAVELNYGFVLSKRLSGNIFTRFKTGLTNVLKNNTETQWKNYGLMVGFGIGI